MFPESTSVLLLQEEGLYALLQVLRRYVLDMGGGPPVVGAKSRQSHDQVKFQRAGTLDIELIYLLSVRPKGRPIFTILSHRGIWDLAAKG